MKTAKPINYDKKKSQFSLVAGRLVRNKSAVFGMSIISIIILIVIFADLIIPYDYFAQDYTQMFQPLSSQHLFGTDAFGRDIFSRVIYGTRYSVIVSLGAILVSAIIGGILGAIAGYYGGMIDTLVMRFLDVYTSIPHLVMCLAFSVVFGRGVGTTILALGLSGLGGSARILRGSVMQVKNSEYIEASKAVKGNDLHIILKHVIPNAISPLIVNITMGVGSGIISIASLGFVGMGLPTNLPEWGAMLAEGRQYMSVYPHLVLVPGIAIIITVLAFNLFGDGLRDALDPRLKD